MPRVVTSNRLSRVLHAHPTDFGHCEKSSQAIDFAATDNRTPIYKQGGNTQTRWWSTATVDRYATAGRTFSLCDLDLQAFDLKM